MFLCSSVCWSPPLQAIQHGLRPSQPGLRPSQQGLTPSQPNLRSSQPDLRPSQQSLKAKPVSPKARAWQYGPEGGWMEGQTDGWKDGRMNKCPENLSILQGLVQYQDHCPTPAPLPKNIKKIQRNMQIWLKIV